MAGRDRDGEMAALKARVERLSRQLAAAEERNRELRRESARLSADVAESNRAKEAFFANMSHEIRTPLNAITGFSRLLMATELSEQQRYYAQQVTDGGELLLRLINTLFDLSKLESGALHLKPAPFVVEELLQRLRQELQPLADKKGLTLEIAVDDAIPGTLTGDGQRIHQVLFNLVENGIKFTEQGKVKLEIDLLPGGADGADRLRMRVTDSGIGMDEELCARLFRPFSVGDDSLIRSYGGTGIGLAVSYRLVSLMGGEMHVRSRKGEGSCFAVEIPLQSEAVDASPPVEELAGHRVLLVDDQAINRQVAREIMEDWGLEVIEAENGAHALRLLEEQACDLVLMDLLMPEMGGLEAARRIREQERFAALPIVAMTGNGGEEDRAQCLAAGMDDVLVKPIDFDGLPQRLAAWLHCHEGTITPLVEKMETDVPSSCLPSLQPAIRDADRDQALRALGGDEALYRQLLEHFSDEHAETPAKLRRALSRGDQAAAERLLHTLKSSAASLGARALAECCARYEKRVRRREALTEEALQAVEQGCTQLRNILQQQVGKAMAGGEEKGEHYSDAELAREVAALCAVLERGEERAIAMLDRLLPALCLRDAAESEAVRQLVDGFDFVAAAEKLRRMMQRMEAKEG